MGRPHKCCKVSPISPDSYSIRCCRKEQDHWVRRFRQRWKLRGPLRAQRVCRQRCRHQAYKKGRRDGKEEWRQRLCISFHENCQTLLRTERLSVLGEENAPHG